MKKYIVDPEYQRLKEEHMHPSQCLGYDHDSIAVHLIKIRAYDIAEAELRRAVYLNPYESSFRVHLALCLWKLKKNQEAEDLVVEIFEEEPDNAKAKEILEILKEEEEWRK